MSGHDCEANVWFSRDICVCGDMHYFCGICGARLDRCDTP